MSRRKAEGVAIRQLLFLQVQGKVLQRRWAREEVSIEKEQMEESLQIGEGIFLEEQEHSWTGMKAPWDRKTSISLVGLSNNQGRRV